MRYSRFSAFGLILLAAACASGGGGGGESGGSSDRYLITAEDLAPFATLNLYEAVNRLRRFWLQGSGGRSPRVFINTQELGGAPSLEEYGAADAAEVRFIQPNVAMTQFGPDYVGGVIQVILR
jgi:hypothetical protein